MLAATGTDKKHAAGRLRWVLPTADGVVVRDDVPEAVVATAVDGGPRGRRPAGAAAEAGHDARARAPGAEPQPARDARAGDLRPRDAGRDPRRDSRSHAAELGLDVDFFQSNHEGALIDRLHQRDFDVAIVNAAGLTHTSIALRDALLGVQRPFWEVHLSDPSTREPFRHLSYLHDVAQASIVGQESRGYHVALEAIAERFGDAAMSRGRRDGHDRPPDDRRARRRGRSSSPGSATRSTRSTCGSSRCSTSGPPWAGRRATRSALAGRRAVHDPEREREVLLRVAMGNDGPLAQADLLSIYRRIVAVTRSLETRDRHRDGRDGDG